MSEFKIRHPFFILTPAASAFLGRYDDEHLAREVDPGKFMSVFSELSKDASADDELILMQVAPVVVDEVNRSIMRLRNELGAMMEIESDIARRASAMVQMALTRHIDPLDAYHLKDLEISSEILSLGGGKTSVITTLRIGANEASVELFSVTKAEVEAQREGIFSSEFSHWLLDRDSPYFREDEEEIMIENAGRRLLRDEWDRADSAELIPIHAVTSAVMGLIAIVRRSEPMWQAELQSILKTRFQVDEALAEKDKDGHIARMRQEDLSPAEAARRFARIVQSREFDAAV